MVREIAAEESIDALAAVLEVDPEPRDHHQVGLAGLDEDARGHTVVVEVEGLRAHVGLGDDRALAHRPRLTLDRYHAVREEQGRLGHPDLKVVLILAREGRPEDLRDLTRRVHFEIGSREEGLFGHRGRSGCCGHDHDLGGLHGHGHRPGRAHRPDAPAEDSRAHRQEPLMHLSLKRHELLMRGQDALEFPVRRVRDGRIREGHWYGGRRRWGGREGGPGRAVALQSSQDGRRSHRRGRGGGGRRRRFWQGRSRRLGGNSDPRHARQHGWARHQDHSLRHGVAAFGLARLQGLDRRTMRGQGQGPPGRPDGGGLWHRIDQPLKVHVDSRREEADRRVDGGRKRGLRIDIERHREVRTPLQDRGHPACAALPGPMLDEDPHAVLVGLVDKCREVDGDESLGEEILRRALHGGDVRVEGRVGVEANAFGCFGGLRMHAQPGFARGLELRRVDDQVVAELAAALLADLLDNAQARRGRSADAGVVGRIEEGEMSARLVGERLANLVHRRQHAPVIPGRILAPRGEDIEPSGEDMAVHPVLVKRFAQGVDAAPRAHGVERVGLTGRNADRRFGLEAEDLAREDRVSLRHQRGAPQLLFGGRMTVAFLPDPARIAADAGPVLRDPVRELRQGEEQA